MLRWFAVSWRQIRNNFVFKIAHPLNHSVVFVGGERVHINSEKAMVISHDDVREDSVSHNGNLVLLNLPKVIHNFLMHIWLLVLVSNDFKTECLFNSLRLDKVNFGVVAASR